LLSTRSVDAGSRAPKKRAVVAAIFADCSKSIPRSIFWMSAKVEIAGKVALMVSFAMPVLATTAIMSAACIADMACLLEVSTMMSPRDFISLLVALVAICTFDIDSCRFEA
jgi:hypothetical protein